MSSPEASSSSSFCTSSPSSPTNHPTVVTDNSAAPEIMDPSALLIKVLSPADNSDLSFHVLPKSTVGELKRRISAALHSRPENDQQRLIYRGKMLVDELVVENVLGLAPGKDGAGETPEEAYTFHLVIRPPAVSPTTAPPNPFSSLNPSSSSSSSSSSSPPSNTAPPSLPSQLNNGSTTTTTATRSFTPGSSSSTVTTTTTTHITTIRDGTSSVPGAPGVPNFATMSLEELRQTLRQRAQAAEQQQSNLAARQRLSEDLARMNEALGHRIAAARQNFNTTTGGLGRSTGFSIPAQGSGTTARRTDAPAARLGSDGLPTPPTPVASGSGSVAGPSEGATRSESDDMHEQIGQMLNLEGESRRRALLAMQRKEAERLANLTTPGSSDPAVFGRPAQQATSNNLLGGNNLIYLLQDASGMPTALLVGPPGSAAQALTPAPPIDMRWQPGGFAMPLGADFGHIPRDLRAMGFPAPEAANGIFNAGGFGFQDPHARAVVNRRNGNPINIGEVLAGIRARAGHFWLAVRLAVFVLLFTGSGGWRRMLYLGSIAVLIFIWQTGIFNEFFRPLADIINPPPNAGAFPLPRPAPAPGAIPNQPQLHNQPLARDANGNPVTPAQTANMLMARRNDGVWEIFRGVERGITIFLASLVPGLHERHVDAVEARQREVQQLRDAQEAAHAAAVGEVAGAGAGGEQAEPQQGAEMPPAGGNGLEPALQPEIIQGLL